MSPYLLFVSFLGGVFTVLAPCTLPLLPVLIGTGVTGDKKYSKYRPLVIISAFGLSVFAFSLVLNWLSKNLGIAQSDITFIAGIILIIFGIFIIFPQPWQWVTHALKIDSKAGTMASKTQKNFVGDVCLGFLLGPILQSCSPTYGILLATILPGNFAWGLLNIIAFIIGMMLLLLLIAYGSRGLLGKIRSIANPHGWARKIVAMLIIITGILIVTGWEKQLGAWLSERGIGLDVTEFEYNLLQENTQEDL